MLRLIAFYFALSSAIACAFPMPSPAAQVLRPDTVILHSTPTPTPHYLPSWSTPDEALEFYKPSEKFSFRQKENEPQAVLAALTKQSATVLTTTLIEKRAASDSYPSFPAQYPSCYNCEQKYSSLSNCMEASSVFQNATNIFNSPLSYISAIKCACTDTFQAVYPQCVECFQLTDQCYYLGTDAAGTGAPQIVTNIRNICGFASSLLGGAEAANYPNYNFTYTPSVVPTFTDVTTTGVGYINQATGNIFSNASVRDSLFNSLPFLNACFAATVAMLFSF